MTSDFDSSLVHRNRTLRTLPGKLLLGPTGARLWADYLDPVPGFRGRVDFIHKFNIPLLFSVKYEGGPDEMLPLDSIWRPSMLELNWRDDRVNFKEHKFITWNDEAVSVQRWENRGSRAITVTLSLPDWVNTFCESAAETGNEEPAVSSRGKCWASGTVPAVIHGIKPLCVIYIPGVFEKGKFILPPGGAAEFVIAAAVGNSASDDPEKMKAGLLKLAGLEGAAAECVEQQKKEYLEWFNEVPVFESSDPLLDQTWRYRWFIVRHNIARPDSGNFHHTLFYEGRSHKNGKEIYKPSGWEFSKLIPLSTPLQLADSRWYGDAGLSREALRSLCDSMDNDGLFRVLFADENGKEYANYAGWALYRFWLAHKDTSFIREVLDYFKANVKGVYRAHESANDHLQIETVHQLTGKEYQPGYWYFSGYPEDVKNKATYTPLKRVDRSVYLYLNALGVARLCEISGDPGGAEFFELAENIRKDILKKMWEEKSRFFYDLHYETDELAPVKNIVGVYPLWAEMTGIEHSGALDYLFDPEVFNTGSGFSSTERGCPVFSAEGGWKGHFIKGRNGCMWNGPSWPYTTAIALDAIAVQTKKYNLGLDAQFMQMLRSYSFQHFKEKDIARPYLVEHYNSITGEDLSDEADYFHSYYIDLIVRHIAGIEPEEDGFRFQPCRSGLSSFSLKKLKLQGHRVDVSFRVEPGKDSEAPLGLHIWIDGKEVHESAGLPESAVTFRFEKK